MKLLALSDVHQMPSKWKDLVKVCQKEKPDVCAIAGDLFPKDRSITKQHTFLPYMYKYAELIRDTGADLVLTMGNDDNYCLSMDMEKADKDGLWHYLHGDICEINGYEFIGCPWVKDHPFGYKDWCRKEFKEYDNDIVQGQRCAPLTAFVIVEEDHFGYELEEIEDYEHFLESRKSIQEMMETLVGYVKDMKKSIWLIHNPPLGTGLDVTGQWESVGSRAVAEFIMKYQPFLTLHGHIHKSPNMTGKWFCEMGDTLCIQPGQITPVLHYVMMDIEDGNIISMEHSVYE